MDAAAAAATAAATAVRFRVLKGSKFIFECEIARTKALPAALQSHVVRADEMALLRKVDIVVTKRLNLVEVDRMIAICREHPPQALVTAAEGVESTAFAEFAAYLKLRERAGVGSISAGLLVLLIPLADRDDYMRCQIVNTTTTVGEIGAQITAVFAPAIEQRVQLPESAPHPDAVVSAHAPPTNSSATERTNPEQLAATAPETGDGDADPALLGDVDDDDEEEDPFGRLREEHAAFNAFYHHVLLEWSTKPSNSDSIRDLEQQS